MTACEQKKESAEPHTPQEMYAKVHELLQPNAEHDASDFQQAFHWLQKAAEGGLLQAQTDLGGIYLEGGKANGIKPDGKQAYYWFSKAADQGSKESLYYMGVLLHRGFGIDKNESLALDYWRRAAQAGVAEAQLRLGVELARTTTHAREGADWLIKCVKAAVPKTSAQAACALGNIYAKGLGDVQSDMKEAARWYELAARGGDASAQLVYALMLMQGQVVEQNMNQGMSYLRLAAGQDNPRAIATLVNLLRNMQPTTPETEKEAEAWAARLEQLRNKKPALPATEAQNAPE